MENYKFVGVNLDTALYQRLQERCKESRGNVTWAVVKAVEEWLSRQDAAITIDQMLQIIKSQETQIATLEARSIAQDARIATLEQHPGAKLFPPANHDQDYPAKADGKRWLTTLAAYEIAVKRGVDRGHDAALKWMRRHPEKCCEQLGLRHIKNTSKSPISTRWEDLRYSPEDD
jgi:hypothetical protein